MKHGQGTIGWLGWVRRSRLMLRTWKAHFNVHDPVRERRKDYRHTYDRYRGICQYPDIGDGWVLSTHHLANLA